MDWQQLIHFDQQLLLKLNGSDSLFWDGFMMTVTRTGTWIPLAVVLFYVLIKNNNMRNILFILLMIALTITIADQFASTFCKPYFKRFRPTNDPILMYQVDVVNNYRGGLYGFISSHAANTFGVFVYVSLLIRNRLLTATLFIWALLCSYSRIYLGVHYPGDILTGALEGSAVGALLWYCTRLFQQKNGGIRSYISSQYTSTGYLQEDVHLLLLAFYLTLCYAAIQGVVYWM
jgi:undecaprenyl-diphosphatase